MSEFTPDNAAMLLIDHQTGIMSWAKSIPPVELVRNTRALARVAKALAMPTVLTTSMEDRPGQGELMKDLEEILPDEYARRVKRLGVVDCMDDPNYAAAVKQTGRKNLIMAGVTNDVCIVFPARRAVREVVPARRQARRDPVRGGLVQALIVRVRVGRQDERKRLLH